MKQKKKRKLLNRPVFYDRCGLSGKGSYVPGIRIMLGAAAVITALALLGQGTPSAAPVQAEPPARR
jgi:hypothetical protein